MSKNLMPKFVWVVLLLFACSAPGPVKLYDGDSKPTADIVQVELPIDIDVVKVDGRDAPLPMVARGNIIYEMLPGEHELVMRYEQLWTNDDQEPEVISSEYVSATFTGLKGQKYLLKENMPTTFSQAKVFAKDLSLHFVTKDGEKLESRHMALGEKPWSVSERLLEKQKSAVDELKYWWGQASQDERSRFLEFARSTE